MSVQADSHVCTAVHVCDVSKDRSFFISTVYLYFQYEAVKRKYPRTNQTVTY